MKRVTEYLNAATLRAWVTHVSHSLPPGVPVWRFIKATKADDNGMVPVRVLRSQEELDRRATVKRPHTAMGPEVPSEVHKDSEKALPARMTPPEHTVEAAGSPRSDLDGLEARYDSGGYKTLGEVEELPLRPSEADVRATREARGQATRLAEIERAIDDFYRRVGRVGVAGEQEYSAGGLEL